jgi:hypothetical protein
VDANHATIVAAGLTPADTTAAPVQRVRGAWRGAPALASSTAVAAVIAEITLTRHRFYD